MDSQLMVEQMSGRWRIKHPSLRDLARQTRAIAAEFSEVTVEWIPPGDNQPADRLANQATDDHQRGV